MVTRGRGAGRGRIHAQQLEPFGGRPGILDAGALRSALARPRNLLAYGGEEIDLADLAVTYLVGLATRQGCADGNKRSAVAAMLVFLHLNGRPLHVDPPALYRVAIGVARGEIEEAEVAEWVRRNL